MTFLRCSLKFNRYLQFVRRFSSERPFQEVTIPVPWGEIRGKWWGPTDVRPILTIHGWQDNCGSFDRLIPLLDKNIGFLAIDLPGHGYSSNLSAGMYYHFTTDIFSIKYVQKYFQWPKVSFMAHSMGAITSFMYTSMYPGSVDFLACFDAIKPWIFMNHVACIADGINGVVKCYQYSKSSTEPPSYTIQEMEKKVHAPHNGSINLEFASYILKRNIAHSKLRPGKYYFTRDPRLKYAGYFGSSQAASVENAQRITCPIFITKFKQSPYFEEMERFYEVLDVVKKHSADCDFHHVEGTHHAHLNNPERFAKLLRNFIQKHSAGERDISGFRKEIIVTEEQDTRLKISI